MEDGYRRAKIVKNPEAGRLSYIPEAVSSVKVRFSKKKKQNDEKKRHEKARIGGKNNLKKGFNVDDT